MQKGEPRRDEEEANCKQISEGLPEDGDGAAEKLRERHGIVGRVGESRTLLYKWRDQMEAIECKDGPPANSRERALRPEIRELKRVLADKTLETDSSKVPCKKSRLDARAKEARAGRRLRNNRWGLTS